MRGGGKALSGVLLLALAGTGSAVANGRFPSVQSITFRPGNPTHVVAGVTFGLLVSDNGGATWRWMCEAAVGYGGTYDPDYAYATSGALFATTFDGLHVNRDGCTFDGTALGALFVSQAEVGGGAKLHVAVADPTSVAIATSDDDGVTFPTSTSPSPSPDAWWQSLRVAPSDAQRHYLSGYYIDNGTRVPLLFTSVNGGASFSAMATTGMMLSANSVISIASVSPTVPTTVYAQVSFENNVNVDAIYVSTDAGLNWTRLVGAAPPIAFLVRANGHLVFARPALAQLSVDAGMTWTPLTAAPAITCLIERPDGVVWACTSTTGAGQYRIMSSADLSTWTGILRFEDIAAPVACAAGTTQQDTCVPQWCVLRMQLGIIADPLGCEPSPDAGVDGPIDAAGVPPDASLYPPEPEDGCCESGDGGAPASLIAGIGVLALVLRRRRLNASR